MRRQATDPQEETLWQAKERAAVEYDARRVRCQDLDQDLRTRFASFREADLPAWRDLVARRDQARRDVRAAREEEERAADRWAEHVLRALHGRG